MNFFIWCIFFSTSLLLFLFVWQFLEMGTVLRRLDRIERKLGISDDKPDA